MMRFVRLLALSALCTSSVVFGQVNVRNVINAVALNGGAELNDPNSYQSKALSYVEDFHTNKSNDEIISYYALACIYYASNSKSNKRTDSGLPQFSSDALPGWLTKTNWLTGASYCSWHGITCRGTGISAIELDNNRMYGIFAPEVQILKFTLRVIDLYANFFLVTEGDAGNSWIGQMTNLENFFFGSTSFEYPGVPTYLGALTKLVELDISNSFYTQGPIPNSAFQNLNSLEYLDMADNIYTSTIPPSISRLPDLQYLYLDNVNFLGVDQSLDFIVGMPSIIENWMDYTAFVGSIPTRMAQLSTLTSFSCTFCQLKGSIPTQLGSMQSLDRLWLYQNQLTGTIPTQLGQLARMQYLHVEGNNIRGSMPQQICDNRAPFALLGELGADCAGAVSCQCCTCCGAINCNNFVDGTPAPTFAPNTGGGPPVSEIDVPVGLCFSGDSMVETVEHGRIPLNKLQIGDMIKNGDIVEPVYSFGHNAKDMVATFIQIHADELEKPLELSKDHLLFSRRGIVPASTIVVGDKVVTAAGNLAEVRKVESVLAKGVYAPFTPSGKIAVNGFLASNYITFQEHSESLLIGGHKIINMHWVSHIFMSPHRLLCKFDFDICKAETYTNGMNSWMVQPLRFTLDVLQQGAFIKMLVFVPLFCVVCMAFLLEQSVFLSPLLMLGVVAYILRSKALNKKAP